MKFYGGRISLLPIQEIFYEKGNEHKFMFITDILSKSVEFKIRKDCNMIIEPILDNNSVLVGGKIGRQSMRNLPVRKDGLLIKELTTTYPHVIFLIDNIEQLILIEHNTSAFPEELVIFKHLIKYMNKNLWDKGLEVDIKPLTSKGKFWNLINSATKVYQTRFILKSPNFLGKTYNNLKEILEQEKTESNANQVEYVRSNDSGELKVPQNTFNEQAVGWTEDGGGEWIIQMKSSQTANKKKIFRNKEHISYFEVDYEIEENSFETLYELRKKLNIGSYKKINGDI